MSARNTTVSVERFVLRLLQNTPDSHQITNAIGALTTEMTAADIKAMTLDDLLLKMLQIQGAGEVDPTYFAPTLTALYTMPVSGDVLVGTTFAAATVTFTANGGRFENAYNGPGNFDNGTQTYSEGKMGNNGTVDPAHQLRSSNPLTLTAAGGGFPSLTFVSQTGLDFLYNTPTYTPQALGNLTVPTAVAFFDAATVVYGNQGSDMNKGTATATAPQRTYQIYANVYNSSGTQSGLSGDLKVFATTGYVEVTYSPASATVLLPSRNGVFPTVQGNFNGTWTDMSQGNDLVIASHSSSIDTVAYQSYRNPVGTLSSDTRRFVYA